jgi:hypothetical protein
MDITVDHDRSSSPTGRLVYVLNKPRGPLPDLVGAVTRLTEFVERPGKQVEIHQWPW